jgi:DNA-binding MarR family transcriptional regulator
MRTQTATSPRLARAPRGGVALFGLVRFWSRRWASVEADTSPVAPRVAHIQVLEAIEAARAGGDTAIAAIAKQLGVDRSGASRMVSASVAAGYVEKTHATDDARRTKIGLTRGGKKLLAAARTFQDQTFDELTASWPTGDRRRFAEYLERLSTESRQRVTP